MAEVLPASGRYRYQEVRDSYATLARSEDLQPDNVLLGSGASEMLHAAVDGFTAPDRPMIAMHTPFSHPGAVVAGLLCGRAQAGRSRR